MYETIKFDKEDAIGIVQLSRPDVLNAFSMQMFEELLDCTSRMIAEEVRACIITGEGRAFCVGADLRERKKMSEALPPDASPFHRTAHLNISRRFFETLENLPFPAIAAVNGVAVGGGLELALACDLRIAGASARFGLTEVNIGAIPSAGGTQRLVRLVGLARAKEIILMGEIFDAQRAKDYGLVSEVVEDEKLLGRAMDIARKLTEKAPLALRAAKLALNSAFEIPLARGLELEHLLASVLSVTRDLEEGRRAFAEKRKPDFKGR